MIDSFSRLTPLLAALIVLAAPAPARSADEPTTGGTFTTPGYPPIQPRTGTPGSAAGVPGTAAPRGTGGVNGYPATPGRPGLLPDGFEPVPMQRIEPPPKPSVFQRFVESATGRLLQPFGSAFFADAGNKPPTMDNVPVSADYTVGPGDEVIVRAWGSIDVDYRATIDRNGTLNLPKVGSFVVAGVKASDLERQLRAQIGRLYTNFNLSVSLGQLRGLRVFVVGPAQRPGVYTLPSQSTLLAAMVAAGGPSPSGSMRKVALRRDGKVIAELDVDDFLQNGDKTRDLQLAAGDVVVFAPVGPRVAITGTIDNPAIYELKSEMESLGDVLRYAGGAPVLANPNRVQVERIDPSKTPAARFVEEFRLDAVGLAKPLRDGDLLTLLGISPQFANAVTLKGHVAQPLRYPWKPGMRIRDLIPDREALVSPDFYRRKNLLVQMLDEPDEPADTTSAGTGSAPPATARGTIDTTGPVGSSGPTAPSITAPQPAPSPAPRRPGERMQAAEDREAATRAKKRPAALFDELNWDYAVVERLDPNDLSTQVIPFNLGKAVIQGDAQANIELKSGDVVTVYSQKDVRVPVARQTRLVSLEGEVGAPGVYQIQPGETLKGLIARAGGFSPQAYVYGLEFSREETRMRQRENLTAAIARLEVLSATQAAREAANRRDESVATPGVSVANTATQAQIARLARLEPNGRIALELTPDALSLDALPDVPLDHGDRISVPPRPGFVTVSGAVANTNAFLWKPGRTAGDYMRLAGLDEAADPSNMFILRADGTVNHANDRRGLFGRGNLESTPLQPGDALIVPNQLEFESWGRFLVRNLKDWSQIFSQFGLGAAAIKTLRN